MKILKKFVRKVIAKLPDAWQTYLVRHQINLIFSSPDGIIFKLAETEEELVAALKLLHDSYVQQGFMKPHHSGLRATVYHALPTTSTLIAKKGNQVIGTLSLIRNNPLGVPLEKIFDLKNIKKKTSHFAEVSSLSVHPDYRGHQGIFFLLTKYMVEYTLNYYQVDYWVCAVNPKDHAIYNDILMFDKLEAAVKDYDFVEGAPAIGFYSDIKDLKLRFYKTYSKRPSHQDLFSFYFNPILSLPCFQFPIRIINKVMDPVLTAKVFANIFIERTQLLDSLSDEEINLLRTAYSSAPHFLELIPLPKEARSEDKRRNQTRFGVRCEGYLQALNQGSSFPILVLDVSSNGFMAELPKDIGLDKGQNFMARIKLGPCSLEDLFVKILWVNNERQAGFEIINSSNFWGLMISQLMEDFKSQPEIIKERRKKAA